MSSLPWMDFAEAAIGTEEFSGSRSNPEILAWAKELNSRYYTDDSIPWCGLFMAHCFHSAGCSVKFGNFLWALDWRKFGVRSTGCYGALGVFGRNGGGHVALYVSEDDDYYHILGGNQGDKVSVVRHSKSSLIEWRWPKEYLHLKVEGPIFNRNFVPG